MSVTIEKNKINAEKGKQGFQRKVIKRNKAVTFVLTENELKDLKEKVKNKGISRNEYLRFLIRTAD